MTYGNRPARKGAVNFLEAGIRRGGLVLAIIAVPIGAWAQVPLSAETPLPADDLAVLESESASGGLSCQVRPDKPYLGFDLRFHVHYQVTMPVRMLTEARGGLHEVLRVRSAIQGDPEYLVQNIGVPSVPPRVTGMGSVTGGFDVGLGRYRVDWMMRDRSGRACSSHWNVEARLGSRDRSVVLAIPDNTAAASVTRPLEDEAPAKGVLGQAVRVKILLNLSPVGPQEGVLNPRYARALLSMVQSIVREPGVSQLSLIAFDLRAQKIVYERNDRERIDFAALGKTLDTQPAATIDYHLLRDKNSEVHFLTNLLVSQLGDGATSQDAIIILGPKVSLERKVPLEMVRAGGAAPCPIFYLNYNPDPFEEPFADTISLALKAYTEVSKFDIGRPADFGAAMRNIRMVLRNSGSQKPHPQTGSTTEVLQLRSKRHAAARWERFMVPASLSAGA
jgi:hypothetical protein